MSHDITYCYITEEKLVKNLHVLSYYSDSTVFGPVKIGEGARVTNSVVSYVCPQPVPIVGEDAD